jgi:hypothetical protein
VPKRKLLALGCAAVVVAGAVGVIFSSWNTFALACVGLGVLIEVIVAVGAQGDASPRDPEVSLSQMKATQYGKVEAVELPTDASSWRPLLLGIPALVTGAAAYFILAL